MQVEPCSSLIPDLKAEISKWKEWYDLEAPESHPMPQGYDEKLSPLERMLGPVLLQGAGANVATADALDGKVVGVYFSAHWCPPCRGFTPKLAALYEALVAAGKSFEVVFVSSDRDDAQFDEYYGTHPWAAVPFANRDAKNALSRKFKVQGIPTFVLVDGETGELINADGRDVVLEDPSGAGFPWQPPSLRERIINVTKERARHRHIHTYPASVNREAVRGRWAEMGGEARRRCLRGEKARVRWLKVVEGRAPSREARRSREGSSRR